jgi:RNA polymerase sigma-70 factor, ECF subfamily
MNNNDKPEKEEELIRLLAANPHLHFELVVKEYSVPLYKYVYKKTRNAEDTGDIIQDALANAYRALKGFPPEYILTQLKLRAWLYAITYHAFVDLYKRSRRFLPATPIDTVEDSPLLDLVADLRDQQPERAAELVELLQMTEKAILHNLPEAYRETAHLYFIGELSEREIADVLNISVNTIKARIRRSKPVLRKRLGSILQTSKTLTKEEK